MCPKELENDWQQEGNFSITAYPWNKNTRFIAYTYNPQSTAKVFKVLLDGDDEFFRITLSFKTAEMAKELLENAIQHDLKAHTLSPTEIFCKSTKEKNVPHLMTFLDYAIALEPKVAPLKEKIKQLCNDSPELNLTAASPSPILYSDESPPLPNATSSPQLTESNSVEKSNTPASISESASRYCRIS